MFNVTITHGKEGQKITIVCGIGKGFEGKPSASGKSVVIASTEGNVAVPGTDLTLGLNLYRRK